MTKKITPAAIALFFLLAPRVHCHAGTEIFLKPAVEVFSDGTGFSAVLGADWGENSGWFAGAQTGMLTGGLNAFSLLGISLEGRAGFRLEFGPHWRLGPVVMAGGGYAWFTSGPLSTERFFLTVTPALEIDFRPAGPFGICAVAGYRYFLVDVYQGGVWHAGVRFSYRFESTLETPPAGSVTNLPPREPDKKKPLDRYSVAEIRKLPIRTIVETARQAIQENDREYARSLVKEGLVREPDNRDLLGLFSELLK